VESDYNYLKYDAPEQMKKIGLDQLKVALEKMLLIRHFEIRSESAYLHGKIGGFFHAYTGQEAIATAAVDAIGVDANWWTTTYRCHALALLTGVSPNEAMAELYGKANGNAQGRGGSMHLYSDRMLGGFGIVGGHMPIIAGAAFSLKYLGEKGVSVGFLGDGAVVQGAFHESMNLMSLWNLPGIVVIENNQWGMGTAVKRAVCVQPIAEHFGKAYDVKSITVDGMDYLACHACFEEASRYAKEHSKPVLIEAVTERFKGHSVSDPGLYRTKDELEAAKKRDPIVLMRHLLEEAKILQEGEFDALSEEKKQGVLKAMEFAESGPDPDPITLEEGVFA